MTLVAINCSRTRVKDIKKGSYLNTLCVFDYNIYG